ncbi:MAG: class F sortase, partial [Pseudonocardia sp.]|nr:class F sortase [Pseudonocardia sp.]
MAVAAVVAFLVLSPSRPEPPVAAPKPAPAPVTPKPTVERGFRVIVPSIGADAPVIPEGSAGGALDVPTSVHVVGWWDGVFRTPAGTTVQQKVAAPGESGVALLAGHIDSATQGHGVFYRLGQAKPGAAVTVIDAHQKVTHWKVTHVQTVLKSALPKSLFVNKGQPQLALVSCGGPFDSATGHYMDNIIAWAVPVSA